MTDAEMMRLEKEAREVLKRGVGSYVDGLARDMAMGVLELADRVRDAERKGAEEMRETAAKRLEWRGAECWAGDSTTATTMRRMYSEEANEIRRLPLAGGEEKKS